MINSKSDEKLDYDAYPDGLNVIAIGGNKLSRGLTLEGLCVSPSFGEQNVVLDPCRWEDGLGIGAAMNTCTFFA